MTRPEEDVGRHTGVDKVVGILMLERRLPFSGLSGRASSEIVQKGVAAGLESVAAVSAPLAIDPARQSNLVLVGFLRGSGFNVHAGSDRAASPATAR